MVSQALMETCLERDRDASNPIVTDSSNTTSLVTGAAATAAATTTATAQTSIHPWGQTTCHFLFQESYVFDGEEPSSCVESSLGFFSLPFLSAFLLSDLS